MAKKSAPATSTALALRDPNQELEPWEQEMLEDAERERELTEGIGGGLRASIRGGKLKVGGNPVPGNKLVCVIVAAKAVKHFYEGDFKASDEGGDPPVCYAFGNNHKGLVPHPESAKRQCDNCDACKHNEFGTAKTGNGKACKDAFSLAFIEAGSMGTNGVFIPYNETSADLARFRNNEVVKISIPATSLKEFKKYQDNLRENFGKSVGGVYTEIEVTQHDKGDYPVVTFKPINALTRQQWEVIKVRSKAVEPELTQPYPKAAAKDGKKSSGADEPKAKSGKGKGKKGGDF